MMPSHLTIYSFSPPLQLENFKIPVVPSTTNKSIRFPNNVIADVEKAIEGKGCTFTAFVVEAVRVALRNLDEERP